MRKLLGILCLLLVMMAMVSCGSQPAEQEQQTADVTEPAETEKDDVFNIPQLSDEEIYSLYDQTQPYVEANFYLGTPMNDLDPDWSTVDSNYANPSLKYHSLDEFRTHMLTDYALSERFVDFLLENQTDAGMLSEHDGGLYVVAANRGSDITVGNEIRRVVMRVGDALVTLRITYETVDDTTGEHKVTGSFDSDNVLLYENGRWVWDEIVEYR